MVNKACNKLIYKVFPGRCLICLSPSQRPLDLCHACESELPWLGSRCRQCALPLPTGQRQELCGLCQKKSPRFSQCICPFQYGFPLDQLLNGFKHRHRLSYGALLAELWLAQLPHAVAQDLPELLVPVPLHWRRHISRGYNQATVLARHWSTPLGIPLYQAVSRRQHTPAQQGLSATERRRNLRSAFVVHKPDLVRGRHIAVVDDVVTTTATANAMAAILARSGASKVDIWCLARTP